MNTAALPNAGPFAVIQFTRVPLKVSRTMLPALAIGVVGTSTRRCL